MQVIDFQVIETPPCKKNETYATALLILTEEELIAIDLLDTRLVEKLMVSWSRGYKTLQDYKVARLKFHKIYIMLVKFLIFLSVFWYKNGCTNFSTPLLYGVISRAIDILIDTCLTHCRMYPVSEPT